MRNTLSLWLAAVIVVTIVAFLGVFKPLTFQPRRDPSDPSQFLRPLFVDKFASTEAPKATVPISSGFGLYFYAPQHDLRLDLDLRGGMRVVLEIPDRAEYVFKLNTQLTDLAEIGAKQKALADALAAPEILGAAAKDPAKVSVVVDGSTATITIIQPESQAAAENDVNKMTAAMTKAFDNANAFTEPAKDSIYKPVTQDEQNQIASIMEKRLNGSGTSEVRVTNDSNNRVVLEIPGVKDPDRVRKLLHTTAQLQFWLIPQDIRINEDHDKGTHTASRVGATGTSQELTDAEVLQSSYLVIQGTDLDPDGCRVGMDSTGKTAVDFVIKPEAQEKFAHTTATNVDRQLAIVLDEKIQTAPVIKSEIRSNGQITGSYTPQEAQDLVVMLKAGALPVPVKIVQNRTVSATLGQDSVSMSMLAGLVGLGLVLIFMAAYYRLPGLMADLALVVYVVLTLGVLKLCDVTLSLSGIAGIIISIGMAVDANVIIFERLKEELRTKKPLETAIDVAFSRAWTAILDSNMASIITGTVLATLGTGAVKGFAVTLIIGVVVSLFTAVTVTRLFMKLMIRSKAGHNLAWYGI